jgi:uncharacterized membrane protein YukC
MALNGIDAQITTQRAMDLAKNASSLNKRNELMQDYMALQRKAEDEIQDTMISKLERKDDPRITREHKGAGQESADERKERGRKASGTAEDQEEAEEPAISGRIDIRI